MQDPNLNQPALDEDDPKAFKRGAIPLVAIGVGVGAAALLAAFLFIGYKQEEVKVDDRTAAAEAKKIFVLPKKEQLPKWREWAAKTVNERMRREAMKQLAFAKDPEGVKLAIQALDSLDIGTQGRAATVLGHFGTPMADAAKDKLLAMLPKANPGSRTQIAWALVELKETRAWPEVLKLYREGHLSDVRRLDRGNAFDPEKLAGLTTLDELAKLASAPEVHVRQLVAQVIARAAKKEHTSVLVKMLDDSDSGVLLYAAPGLGRIGGEEAVKPLAEKLKKANQEQRDAFKKALKAGLGARGLVLAFQNSDTGVEMTTFARKENIALELAELADPTGSDAIVELLKTEEHPYFQTLLSFALAEVGDLRAVPFLAKRLRMDEKKIYSDEKPWEQVLKKGQNRERVKSASYIADLAKMHPEKIEAMREQAEDALSAWSESFPFPQDEAWRALAELGSKKDLDKMRKWGKPTSALPREGAGTETPVGPDWEYGGTALRYLGRLKDQQSWNLLEDALKKRPREYDLSRKSLDQGGLTRCYQALNGVQVGAMMGFAEWGDAKAFKQLVEFVEEPKELEDARTQACYALSSLADQGGLVEIAKRIVKYKAADGDDAFRRMCFLTTLTHKPIAAAAGSMLELMKTSEALPAKRQAARALGKGGFDDAIRTQLLDMLKDDKMRNEAALALILGADADTASQVIARYGDRPKQELEELQQLWSETFVFVTPEDVDTGRIFHWLDNASAIARVQIGGLMDAAKPDAKGEKDKAAPKAEKAEGEAADSSLGVAQKWAEAELIQRFKDMEYDNGPMSVTRTVLRHKLITMAKGNDKDKREGAFRALLFLKEQGVLFALTDEQGEVGQLAKAAYHRLLNPVDYSDVKVNKKEKAE